MQHRHLWLGRVLRRLGDRIATGEGTIKQGPAAGLRIDATGRMPGYVVGTADYAEQVWLAENLKAGQTFYDIGANIGFFTLLGARLVGERGAVVAFEPLPENISQLERNVALNGLTTVMVVPAAVADSETNEATFWLGADADARDTGRLAGERPEGGTIRVPVTTLDSALVGYALPHPSMVKIDVEGEEVAVLRGGLETIRTCRPLLLVEVHWIGRAFTDFVATELAPLGYRAETISGEPLPSGSSRFHAALYPV